MTCHSTTLAALVLGLVSALTGCAEPDAGYAASARTVRPSAYGGPNYDCRAQGLCGDPGNPIPGTNAIVGPGPRGEDWHKEPRE